MRLKHLITLFLIGTSYVCNALPDSTSTAAKNAQIELLKTKYKHIRAKFTGIAEGDLMHYQFEDAKGEAIDFVLIEDNSIELTVASNAGESINPKYQNKYFDIFYQVEKQDPMGWGTKEDWDVVKKIIPVDNHEPVKKPAQSADDLKSTHKHLRAKFVAIAVGDLFHYQFQGDKGEEYDFVIVEDKTYELSVADDSSESGESINPKYQNKYFDIYYKVEKQDPMGEGTKEDWDVVKKLILVD